MLFLKSLVHAHTRRNKSGSVSFIADYRNNVHPKGTEVMFKPAGGKSYRSGTVVNVGKTHYAIQGKRQGSGAVETHRVPKIGEPVFSMQEWTEKKTREDAGGKREAASSVKRILPAEESNRRAAKGMSRLGMTEDEIVRHPMIKGYIIAQTRNLAVSNGLNAAFRKDADFIQVEDADYQDMVHEFTMGMLNGLRREAAGAPKADIEEFKRHLSGEANHSRVFATMAAEGRGAAIRFLKQRKKEKESLVDLAEVESPRDDDGGQRRQLAAEFSVPPTQEQDVEAPLRPRLDGFLAKLPAEDAELIRLKFGVEDDTPLTHDQIAERFNQQGSKYQGKYKWDRNHVGAAIAAALERLRSTVGIEALREFLKSLREQLDLIKSQHRKTIAVDFDGVIADYSQGFQGRDTFGEPLPHAGEGTSALKAAGWKVVIFTTRSDTPELRRYLKDNAIAYDEINTNSDQPEGANPGKPIADVYLDDRAIRFTGWDDALAAINGLQKSVFLYAGVPLEALRKSFAEECPAAEVMETAKHLCLVFPTGTRLAKSYSSDLAEKYPGSRWITVKEGPLAGRHILIVPHKDGTASVVAGGGPAMRHKVLGLKKEDHPADRPSGETVTEPSTEAPPARTEEKQDLSEEKRKEVEAARQERKAAIKDERSKMAEIVRRHLGKEVEITARDREDIEKRIEHIADPKAKAVERLKEVNRVRKEKDDLLHQVAAEAKKAITDEEPTGQGEGSIAAVVKAHAEDLLNHYYRIQSLQREDKGLARTLRSGKELKRPVPDSVEFAPLTKKDLEGIIVNEKARDAELAAHYKLIATTRGYVDSQGREHKVKGGEEVERNIRQGGYEALTGIVGEITGSSILGKDVYDEIGPQNAAVLAHYFLKNSGKGDRAVYQQLTRDIEVVGNDVVVTSLAKGDRFMELARKVMGYGQGDDNLMSAAQALGSSLKYQNKAFEAYGQAEGSLNQAAELAYELKNDKGALEIHAKSEETLERKRKRLRLKAADVTIAKHGDGYRMVIPQRSFEKLIHEIPATSGGGLADGEFSVADIKALKANTDDFQPAMLREYTPETITGETRKIVLKPEQQAAARLIAKQKRLYLNFEAGVGKSLTIIAAKAHIEDETGHPVKTIIAMPQKLMSNFRDEVEKFSNYKVVIVDDADKKKRAAKYASDPDTIVVVNKEKFNFDKALITDAGFHMVVADEAHKVTQREGRSGSEMSRGLADVAESAPYYVAMSGTPTPNDLSELYFHAHVMAPEKFHSQKEFMAQFGSAHKGAGLKDKIKEFMNRELADHVYTVKKALDTKFTLHSHMAELHPAQKAAYRDVLESSRKKEISPLQRDQQLNTILNAHDHRENGKFAEVKGIIDRHLATKAANEKVILYAKNYDTVNQIHDFLRTHYGDVGEAVTFTGREKVKDIRSNKERFKHDPSVRFAVHTRAGVEGLNLQYDGNGGGATTAIAIASGEDSFAPLDQFFSRANRTGALKDIDGHLVLTDTPHDLGTDLRLQEKKGVGELIKSLFLFKSHVREHLRRTKGGAVTVVHEHEWKRGGRVSAKEVEDIRNHISSLRSEAHRLREKRTVFQQGKASIVSAPDKDVKRSEELFREANDIEDHWYAALHPEEFKLEDLAEAERLNMPLRKADGTGSSRVTRQKSVFMPLLSLGGERK